MRGISRKAVALGMVLLLVLTAACAPTPEEITPTVEMGVIEIRVTDPPPPGITSAVVHLTNIEAHKVSGEEGEWIPIVEVPPSFDLLVVAEVEAILGAVEIQAGSFTQIRMDVTEVEVTVDGYPDPISATVPR